MQGGKLMEFGGGRRVKREWQDILPELLMKIVSLLDDHTVIVAAGVCSGWRNAICTQLTHISLSWYRNNMNNLVHSLVPKLTNLRGLTLQPLLDAKSVETIANNCHDLEDLDLSKNYRLGDGSLYTLARGCPNLTKLNISGCSAFSENGIEFVSSYCRKLKILNLFGCYKAATNKALKAIGDNCRQLESINLGGCYNVGDAGVMSLVYGCPHLNAIDLSGTGCFFITGESVMALSNNCLHLRSLGPLRVCFSTASCQSPHLV
ncbi:putative F-box domain, leucine-rich repeat domain superfamily, F-box-like domain superfamily [Helianthus annuus]|nr:putative F-box domain, leucine-rich repeat domain superfamily, F-box-like domain superfamily [Helianthus annuus]